MREIFARRRDSFAELAIRHGGNSMLCIASALLGTLHLYMKTPASAECCLQGKLNSPSTFPSVTLTTCEPICFAFAFLQQMRARFALISVLLPRCRIISSELLCLMLYSLLVEFADYRGAVTRYHLPVTFPSHFLNSHCDSLTQCLTWNSNIVSYLIRLTLNLSDIIAYIIKYHLNNHLNKAKLKNIIIR